MNGKEKSKCNLRRCVGCESWDSRGGSRASSRLRQQRKLGTVSLHSKAPRHQHSTSCPDMHIKPHRAIITLRSGRGMSRATSLRRGEFNASDSSWSTNCKPKKSLVEIATDTQSLVRSSIVEQGKETPCDLKRDNYKTPLFDAVKKVLYNIRSLTFLSTPLSQSDIMTSRPKLTVARRLVLINLRIAFLPPSNQFSAQHWSTNLYTQTPNDRQTQRLSHKHPSNPTMSSALGHLLGIGHILVGAAAIIAPFSTAQAIGVVQAPSTVFFSRAFGSRDLLLGCGIQFYKRNSPEYRFATLAVGAIHAIDILSGIVSYSEGYLPFDAAVMAGSVDAILVGLCWWELRK